MFKHKYDFQNLGRVEFFPPKIGDKSHSIDNHTTTNAQTDAKLVLQPEGHWFATSGAGLLQSALTLVVYRVILEAQKRQ